MTVTHKKAAQILQAWNLGSEAITDIYYDGNKTIVPFYSRADGTDSLSVKGAHKAYDMFGNEISATGKYDGSKNCIYIIFDGKVDASAFTLSAM